VDFVLDNVGGSQLVAIWTSHLAEGGVVQCIGRTSQEDATFTLLTGFRRRLEAFRKGPQSGADIAYLLGLMQRGRQRVDVGWRGSWNRIAEASTALFGRRVAGKAVLDVD
jgi:NADPH2:quinone reductase